MTLQLDMWQGMPEFHQEKVEPFAQLTVRFATKEDMDDFARLIDQKLTPKTKSIWHPFRSHWRDTVSYWVRDE